MYKGKKNLKKYLFGLFTILFIVQIFFFSELSKSNVKYDNISNNIQEAKYEQQYLLLDNIVRVDQNNTLNAIKQSWINYTTSEEKKLVKSDTTGNYPIYSNSSGDYIYYDSNNMIKELINDNYYNIYDNDKNLLISNCKPNWNEEELNKILSYIISPIKCYGNKGGIIVYDSFSGEIFLDTTMTNRSIGSNIFLDYENAKCKNVTLTKDSVNSFIKMKKDSTVIENFIYLFNESTNMNDPNDLQKYPLGKYNRLFAEKMILPYESFGFEGQPMQLTVLIMADEKDIYSSFTSNDDKIKNLMNDSDMLNNKACIVLVVTIFISMIYLSLIAYILKYGIYIFNDEKQGR